MLPILFSTLFQDKALALPQTIMTGICLAGFILFTFFAVSSETISILILFQLVAFLHNSCLLETLSTSATTRIFLFSPPWNLPWCESESVKDRIFPFPFPSYFSKKLLNFYRQFLFKTSVLLVVVFLLISPLKSYMMKWKLR